MNASTGPGTLLCPACGRPQADRAPFCTECGAPLAWDATTDPVKAAEAQGFAARRAVAGADKPVVVVGTWLWLLPIAVISTVGLLAGIVYLLEGILGANYEDVVSGLLAGGVSGVVLWIVISILFRTAKNYRKEDAN